VFVVANSVQWNDRERCTRWRRVPVLFDGTPVGGRVSVPSADGSAQQRPQRRTSGGRGHQETRVRRQEAQVPAGQGAESVHHAGHHHERVHRVLVAVLRAGAGQAVPQRPVQHTQLAEQPVPVAGLRQLVTEPRECYKQLLFGHYELRYSTAAAVFVFIFVYLEYNII
jgi:hypothetical protein